MGAIANYDGWTVNRVHTATVSRTTSEERQLAVHDRKSSAWTGVNSMVSNSGVPNKNGSGGDNSNSGSAQPSPYADLRVTFVSPKVAPKFTAADKATPTKSADPSTYEPPAFERPTFEPPLSGGPNGLDGSPLSGNQGSIGLLPLGVQLVTGPDGQIGADVTGDGRTGVGVNGRALSGGGLPSGSKVVTKNGVTGIDLDGDGNADIGMDGTALPGGLGPPGSRWVTGPDGQSGFDVTGDGVPDIGTAGKALPGGDLPPSARYVTGPDGIARYDLNGDGVAETDPQLMPFPDSPNFHQQLPPPLEGGTSGVVPGAGEGTSRFVTGTIGLDGGESDELPR